ncbi:UNVERIFIED_CONTAM: hypothetical protein K2H54_040765 [Gekko kuhli]
MELWGCSLLLLAMLSVNQAQLKRHRFRELDPVRGEMPRFPGSPGAGECWSAIWDRACPFPLPLWALLVGLSGSVALFVLRVRGRGGTAFGSEPDAQSEEAFLHDVFTVLRIIRNRLSQIVQDRRERQRSLHKSIVEGS